MSSEEVFGFVKTQAQQLRHLTARQPTECALIDQKCFQGTLRERFPGVAKGPGHRLRNFECDFHMPLSLRYQRCAEHSMELHRCARNDSNAVGPPADLR